MQMMEIELSYPGQPGRPPDRDWVPEDEVQGLKSAGILAGMKVTVIGPVSWQRQLAVMENNPE